jgi:hypothetical protein
MLDSFQEQMSSFSMEINFKNRIEVIARAFLQLKLLQAIPSFSKFLPSSHENPSKDSSIIKNS